MLDEKEITYLKNKHTGGISNAKGNDYERFYVIKEILRLCADTENLDSISFVPQVYPAYLDDLKEKYASNVIYCQIKNVEQLRWTDGNSTHTIEEDFMLQSKLCEDNNEQYRLRLVYSNGNSEIKRIPDSILQYTEIEHFRSYDTVEKMIQEESDVVERFKAKFTQFDNTDKVCNFAVSLIGIWASEDNTNQEVRLVDIIKKVDDMGKGYTALVVPTISIPEDIEKLFESFEGISWGVSNGLLNLKYKRISTCVPPTEDVYNRLRTVEVGNVKDLINKLY